MTGVSHHLLLCATASKAKCCDPTVGTAAWNRLKQLVKQLGLEDPDRAEGVVLRSKADCLRICERGPVLLIWPDGCWYGGVTPERLESILRRHVIAGEPIEEWLIQRTPMLCSQATAS